MRGTDGHRHADSRSSRAASSHSPIARRDEPGPKIITHALLSEHRDVTVGDHATPEDHDVIESAVLQLSDDAREEGEMRARQQREPDAIRILLEDGLGDLFGSLMQPGVDDLEPMVPESSGDGLGTAIMTVKARASQRRFGRCVPRTSDLTQPLDDFTNRSDEARCEPRCCATQPRSHLPEWFCGLRSPAPRTPLPRSPEQSSPCWGGVVFFVLLGLITWGIAAFLSSGDTETTDNLAPAASRTRLSGRPGE